jgi:5-methylcytosine-specific restriction endonuclease McrA
MTSEEKRIYSREWRKTNIEKCRAYDRAYYRDKMPMWRKEKKWSSLKLHALKNPEYAKEYYLLHKTEALARYKKRETVKLSQLHPGADLKAISAIYRRCRDKSTRTGVQHDVDHIIPLSAGGWHHELNLQILPSSLNKSKGDSVTWWVNGYLAWDDVPELLWPEWMQKKYQCLPNQK